MMHFNSSQTCKLIFTITSNYDKSHTMCDLIEYPIKQLLF